MKREWKSAPFIATPVRGCMNDKLFLTSIQYMCVIIPHQGPHTQNTQSST